MKKFLGSNTIQSEGGWLGQLALQISELGWNGHDIEVKTAGTFKKDKFIVLQNKPPVAPKKNRHQILT